MDFVETHFLQFGLQKKVARGPQGSDFVEPKWGTKVWANDHVRHGV